MRMLGIAGSPRGAKSLTQHFVRQVLAGAEQAGADVEFIDVCALQIGMCRGCSVCSIKGYCVQQDDFQALQETILASDGMVWGSPLYFNGVTAQLKALIDRMPHLMHCQKFLGKYACAVATSGGPEHDIATDYLNDLLVRFGASAVGAFGIAPGIPGALDGADARAQALGRELVRAIREQTQYPEQEAIHQTMRARFQRLISMNKDLWADEYAYWQNQGWL